MRTNIEINDALMSEALSLSEYKTKKALVEAALKLFVKTRSQTRLKHLKGQLAWDGDLDEMRRD